MAAEQPGIDAAWPGYVELHAEFQRALAEACIIGRVAEAALVGFPANVPPEVAGPLSTTLRAMGEALYAAGEATKAGETFEPVSFEDVDPLALDVSWMISFAARRGVPPTADDFGESVRRQQLVSMLAALDAFLGDTIRMVCRVRPDVLRSGKTITHEDVVAAGSYEPLLARMTDRMAFEAGWGPLRERLVLPKVLGLSVPFKSDVLDALDYADVVRNLVMHAGGIVSPEAKTRAPRLPKPGERVRVTRSDVEGVSGNLRFAGFAVFRAVAAKFFGRSGADLRFDVETSS